ncbi:Serine hydroxymethyltransferase [uncultured Sporomusa sp.]|uniref:Serine hydroxymethyltransferase n=1 Tax=uncultured Sporomusa sp. TaxID=307249 RepID=A0A212M0Z3_9FIRM|nr:serine hydroxymethyltransferase [uncultured Sporomusa sp.]SCM83380.1 Serine hydroxymethyltransferase [uncultured Sporomusa sp.]
MERAEIMNVFGQFDPEMAILSQKEEERQRSTINIIASENFASPLATFLEGGIWANKNSEGYPGKRYVAGCELADAVENLAIKRLKELFQCEHANVQAMSATVGNVAIMNAVLKPGDTILSMELSHGGHLSHGASFHYSGKTFKAVHYGVNRETEQIDMDEVRKLALEHSPKMIICGTSSYPRLIDYAGFAEIAKAVGALFFVDLAHNVGLVAAGVIPSPVPYADIVSSSTHKTFRGPRGGGIILCKKELAGKIDRALFPGLQGAAKLDMIAARAVLFKECMTDEFKRYGKQVLDNAVALAGGCMAEGLRLVAGGTDTHLAVVDVTNLIPSGKQAEEVLASVGIICNKNGIPFDSQPLTLASGIRIGSPFMTTRGMKAKEMFHVGVLVGQALRNYNDSLLLNNIRKEVTDMAAKYPLFADEWLPRHS